MGYIPPQPVAQPPASNPGDLQDGGPGVALKPRFIPCNKVAKVEMRFRCDGQDAENVFYFWQSSGNFSFADLVTLAGHVYDAWVANIQPLWAVNTALTMIRCSDMSAEFGPVVEHAVDPEQPGLRIGVGANNDDCIGIGIHTGFKGRSQNGKLFGSGTLAADFFASLPVDASRTLYLDAWKAFFDQVIGHGYTFCLVSFMTNKQWRTIAQATTVAFLTVGTYIYTMRRRLPGHNRHR